MELSRAYFALQLRFAQRVAEVCQQTFEDSLLHYTNLYLLFINASFDPAHPIWQEYLAGLRQTKDQATWTYTFYQGRKVTRADLPAGCFSYNYYANINTIRIHFAHRDDSTYGALSLECLPVRVAELKAMFTTIKKQHPNAERVRGGSWLYNLPAYRRIFPPEYIKTATPVEEKFQFLALWGQFLRAGGQIREQAVATFLEDIDKQNTLVGISHCFPFQVLRPESSISHFYEFYRV